MDKIKKKTKVLVAMSGGVDSSVAAALLKRAGFDVIGVFMKFWSGETKKNRCCTLESEKRARMVAEKLNIPFYVFNFEKEFKKKVVDYFLKEYKAGRTPNPCVVCNKEIKFGLLLKKVLSLDVDYIATGHYARREGNKLLKGKDKNKDQSYFLWELNQKMLKRILFPVGEFTKSEVRELAKKFKLPVLNIPESQEICFIQTTINDFLKKYLKPKLGKIIDPKGRIVGEHQGLWFYTIGQRKGIKLSGSCRCQTSASLRMSDIYIYRDKPFYVLGKDTERNLLIVTKNEKDLYRKELIAKDINWISGIAPKFPIRAMVKIRYRHNSTPTIIKKYKTGKIKLVFSKSQRAITPGQSVVFYQRQELLGGGIIN